MHPITYHLKRCLIRILDVEAVAKILYSTRHVASSRR